MCLLKVFYPEQTFCQFKYDIHIYKYSFGFGRNTHLLLEVSPDYVTFNDLFHVSLLLLALQISMKGLQIMPTVRYISLLQSFL